MLLCEVYISAQQHGSTTAKQYVHCVLQHWLLLRAPNIYILCISHAVLQGLRNGRSHMRDLSWMWDVFAGPLIPLQSEAICICQTATKGLRIIGCGHSSAACKEQVI